MSYLDILEKSRDLYLAHAPFCLATLVDGRGSIPQIPGSKAIFTEGGLHCGTVGGGRLEKHCEEIARQMMSGRDGARTKLVTLNLNRDLGMTCGGEVTVFFECLGGASDWTVAIFGAGHVAQALCRLLITLDCRIQVYDSRADWLAALPTSPRLLPIQVEEISSSAHQVPQGADILVMTIGHSLDREVLAALARTGRAYPYVGVIGSKSKAAILKKRLAEDGLPKPFIDALICPAGEKLGDNTPPEIAIGIVSQLLKRRRSNPSSP
ncbi:MAG: XdhC family protein [Alphaproteobacteria bacterium]|nr:XdhC family protein [Alphaproteobacteria bacterium]